MATTTAWKHRKDQSRNRADGDRTAMRKVGLSEYCSRVMFSLLKLLTRAQHARDGLHGDGMNIYQWYRKDMLAQVR